MKTFDNPENYLSYSYPGIFAVECRITHNTLFGESDDVYQSLVEILGKLRIGRYENLALQQDFQDYSEDSFRFVPIRFSPELADKEVRLVEFQKILKHYHL